MLCRSEVRDGAADRSMKEFGYCGSRLKQGSTGVTGAGFWLGVMVFSRFQGAKKIREFIRNLSCNVKKLLSDLLLCFQKGRMIFWKTFTIVILLDCFLQPEEMDGRLSCPIY